MSHYRESRKCGVIWVTLGSTASPPFYTLIGNRESECKRSANRFARGKPLCQSYIGLSLRLEGGLSTDRLASGCDEAAGRGVSGEICRLPNRIYCGGEGRGSFADQIRFRASRERFRGRGGPSDGSGRFTGTQAPPHKGFRSFGMSAEGPGGPGNRATGGKRRRRREFF
jgi:hypothetical protein